LIDDLTFIALFISLVGNEASTSSLEF